MDTDVNVHIKAAIKPINDRLDQMNLVLLGLVLALFIGFAATFIAAAAMLVDAYRGKQASFENLQDEVQAQNAKIDLLMEKMPTDWI